MKPRPFLRRRYDRWCSRWLRTLGHICGVWAEMDLLQGSSE